jgi:hypothetical protein
VDVEEAASRVAGAREAPQVVDDRRRPLGAAGHHPDDLPGLGEQGPDLGWSVDRRRRKALAEGRDARRNEGDRVVDLVRDARHQTPE